MNTVLRIMICNLLLTALSSAQTIDPSANLLPDARFNARIVDEEGKPVSKIEVTASFNITTDYWKKGSKSSIIKAISNENGLAAFEGKSVGEWSFGVITDGYYKSYHKSLLAKGKRGGRWEPWDATHDLVVKRILNPIPLCAKRLDELKIPVIGAGVGFDFEVGDWIAPHGKGKQADLFFKLDRAYTSVLEPFDATLTVTFPKPDDGIQTYVAPPFLGSELRLPHRAPEQGYAATLVKWTHRKSATQPIELNVKNDQNYFLRTRTVLKDGKMESAHYTKVHGDFAFDIINSPTALLFFTYYFNPTPNDRNLEFDPQKNLFGKLPWDQRVTAP